METVTTVEFEPDFAARVPGYRTIIIEADVQNSGTSEAQKAEMQALADKIAAQYKVPEINSIPAIAATRAAYKACGKEPNRYRPSQEQLMRRIVRGLGLYNVNTLVDAGNMLSLLTGCPVGCFDADKVDGTVITLGIGKEGEPYEGIGRGPLNIAGMPVFRDATGGFGTPTSDNVRTCLSTGTSRILVTVHLFDSQISANEIVERFTDIFTRYGNASCIRHSVFAV